MAMAVVVSHALARSTYPVLLPAIEEELLDGHQQSGALTTVNFAAYLLGVLAVTSISGRFEPARILGVGLAAATGGFVLLSTAAGYLTLAVGLALAGVGSAGIWMTAPVLATGAVSPRRRGTVMGLLSSSMGLGIVAAGLGTNAIRAAADDPGLWRPTWAAAAAYAALVTAAVVVVLRVPSTERIAGGVSLRRLRTVPAWLPLALGYWCFGIVVSSYTPFFGAALEEYGFSRRHVGNLYSLFGLSAVVGAVGLGRVSDRFGRRPVLLGSLAAMVLAALLVLLGREPWAAVSAIAFGAASFTFPVLVAAYVSDHLGGRAFANALGALTLFYGTALVIGPVLSGTIGDSSLGFPVVFAMVAGFAAIAVVAIARLETRAVGAVQGPPSDAGHPAGAPSGSAPSSGPGT
ncbi:MAG: MFS transporter [Actinomycetota bacterium]